MCLSNQKLKNYYISSLTTITDKKSRYKFYKKIYINNCQLGNANIIFTAKITHLEFILTSDISGTFDRGF